MTSDCLQSAKKEWQAFQSGDSELDCVSCEFTKYGKALLRSRSQSWSREMSVLLCRSSGLCCTSSWGVVWSLVSGPLKIDMGQTSVSSLSQRTSGKCLKGLFSDSLFTHSHRYLSINAQGGKTWLFSVRGKPSSISSLFFTSWLWPNLLSTRRDETKCSHYNIRSKRVDFGLLLGSCSVQFKRSTSGTLSS